MASRIFRGQEGQRMRTISIISLKGGVAKTTTAVNMAYILAEVHKKKVLF